MATAGATLGVRRRSIGRDFRFVWLAVIVSSTGDGMFVTAFPLLAATLTRDPRLIAGVTIAQRLPWLLFSSLTGAIADRMDRRRLMMVADVTRFVVVGVLGVLIVLRAENIWLLYFCSFTLGIGETLHVNAGQAILPKLVDADDLLQANARFGSAQIASAQFIGPPLGVLAFNAATSVPFLADAVSFAGSAALISALPDVHAVERPSSRLRDDVVEGLLFTWRTPALRRIASILALINFFYFAATSLLVLYNAQRLHGGSFTYSLMFVGAATGTVISRFLVSRVVARLGRVRTMAAAFWFWSVPMIGMCFTHSAPVAIAMYGLLGMGTGLWITVNTTIRQQITPTRLLGRMNAAYRTISWGVVPLGAAFGGLTAHHFGLLAPFVIGGAAMVPIALFGTRILRPVAAAIA
jgi:MFS family permease